MDEDGRRPYGPDDVESGRTSDPGNAGVDGRGGPEGAPAGAPAAPWLADDGWSPADADAPWPPRQGGRGPAVRVLTLVLMVALLLVAVLGGLESRPRQVRQVAQTLPPVEQPTGQLARAYTTAREATVRIEARCGGRYGNEPIGLGTGFFIRSDGHVLTAYHVVDPAEQGAPCTVSYVAVTPERLEYPLTLVGFDAYHDLAVLQAEVDRAVPTIALAPALPRAGTSVVAIGNSRNQFLQARAGEVTRLGVHAGRPDFADNTIELTNSLAPGDSGGPVVNAAGQAVGVVSYISFDPTAMTSNTFVPPFLRGVPLPQGYASYAVPVAGSDLVARLEAGEKRDVPVVGFTWRPGLDYDPGRSDVYLGPRPGVIVWQVQPDGPADRAGLRSYREGRTVTADGSVTGRPEADVITAIDGTATPTFYDLLALVRQKAIGQTVVLSVERGNAIFHIPLTLGAQRSVFAPP